MIRPKREWRCSKCGNIESQEIIGRVCGNCFIDKPIEEFYTGEHGNPRTYCMVCTKVKSKERQIRNQTYIREIKESNPCVDCGKFFPFYTMHFDHTSQQKNYNLSDMGGATLEKIKHEISLCELVCANCHSHRTYTRKPTDNFSSRRLYELGD